MVELAGIIILGILAQWLAWRIRVPAILPLILTGLLVGPISTLFTADGEKLLDPIYNPDIGGLFPGESLFYFVSLAIGIILFEGGLTLKLREIRIVGPAIGKLITVGSAITFIGSGLAAHYIMGLSWPISFLFAGLVIVTGPTVIAPILQNVPLTRNVSTVLKWEGILIDPIGALVAVLVFEFIRTSGTDDINFTSHAFLQFCTIILVGMSLGAAAGYALYQVIKRDLIPHYLLNVFTLAAVLCIFVLSDELAHESGLLSVVVMGTVMANLEVPRIKEILSFKESLSVLLISILFILLAANINMEDLYLILNDWRSLALFVFVALVLRPLGVFVSTMGSELNLREKLFISWVGPRGIVAAGIASLFGITLTNEGVPGAQYITPLVFMIVLGTVTLNAATARIVARLLGVIQEASSGVLIVGANAASRVLATYLQEQDRHVVLVDNNSNNVDKARNLGLEAYVANIYNDDLTDQFELLDMGYMVAMTSSSEVNQYAIKRYSRVFGERGSFRLIASDEMRLPTEDVQRLGVLSYTDDFINISEAARDNPEMHEVNLENKEHFLDLLKQMKKDKSRVPIFIKSSDGQLNPIATWSDEEEIEAGYALVYLGQPLEQAVTTK